MFGTYLRQLGEDLLLEGRDFGHSFNDHVDVGKVGQLCGRFQSVSCGFCNVLGYFLFRDIFGKELVGECEAFVEGGLRVVDESDRDLGSLGGDKRNSQTLHIISRCNTGSGCLGSIYHLSCTDNTKFFDLELRRR